MKNWFIQNRKSIILSLVLTLAPMLIGCLIWNQLPETVVTHWGADGVADGYSSKAFAVFAMPAILTGINLLCLILTPLDPRMHNQNKKAQNLIFWIIPIISFTVCSIFYSISLGHTMNLPLLLTLTMGILFLILGNYMPKIKQNSMLGLKISWTLLNEENWNKTHRFTGKIWVAGGIIMLLTILLPDNWFFPVLIAVTLAMVIAPVVYSYRIYKKHKAQGINYNIPPQQKKYRHITVVFLVIIFTFVGILMFTGDITYTCGDDALYIEASYTNDAVISYDEIDSIEFRESFDVGYRVMGFNSVRLSTGAFQNGELKDYTIYSYTFCQSMILIRSGNQYLAINAATPEATLELYQTLLSKIG